MPLSSHTPADAPLRDQRARHQERHDKEACHRMPRYDSEPQRSWHLPPGSVLFVLAHRRRARRASVDRRTPPRAVSRGDSPLSIAQIWCTPRRAGSRGTFRTSPSRCRARPRWFMRRQRHQATPECLVGHGGPGAGGACRREMEEEGDNSGSRQPGQPTYLSRHSSVARCWRRWW